MTVHHAAILTSVILLGLHIGIHFWRVSRRYDLILRPLVEKQGLTWIGSSKKWFGTGPFPMGRLKGGGLRVHVMGISGEYTVYRCVYVEAAQGERHEAWVRLSFNAMGLDEVEWRPPLESLSAIPAMEDKA